MRLNFVKFVVFNLVLSLMLMGTPNASAVTYYALSSSSFHINPDTSCMMNGSDTSPYYAGVLYGPTSGTDCVAYAVIPLPQGTAVSKIEVAATDSDTTCEIEAYLDEGRSTGGSGPKLSGTSTDVGSQTITLRDGAGATAYTLKSGGYAYYIRVIIAPNSTGSWACNLAQVKITY